MSDHKLTMFVHGKAGTGKSWLGASGPPPRLILDAEGRAEYLPGVPVEWDPWNYAPPEPGAWENCIAHVPDFKTMERVYEWLQSGQHPFVSVSVDSLMEVQKRLIDEMVGYAQLDQRGWGDVLRKLEKLVRDYRDLTKQKSNTVRCVIVTCGSKRNDGGEQQPLLQGQLRETVPYYFDIVGYIYATLDTERNEMHRSLLVQPLNNIVAKDNTDRLHQFVVQDPDATQLFGMLNGQTPETTVQDPPAPTREENTTP